ncbi:MAG: flagellar basal body P-ring formation protein FlgA [Rhodobacteraceae bacterium]|nr:flagellar basal body P-ring formation protein FlgA [Paracoccaceae bacterium]
MIRLAPSILLSLAFALQGPALADTVLAKHLIRPRSVISAMDVVVTGATLPNGYTLPEEVIGLEAKNLIYPGRPLGPHNVRPPAIIERNAIVTVHFARKGLEIATEGRALDRAAIGETVKVMNLDSRTTLTGLAMSDGSVLVAR